MGVEEKAICNECGYIGGKDFRNKDGTYTCPRCGSTDVYKEIVLSEQVQVQKLK